MKLIVIAFFAAIVLTLGAGLVYLVNYDRGNTRLLSALKVRVVLSVLLVAFLVFGYYQGWISPNAG